MPGQSLICRDSPELKRCNMKLYSEILRFVSQYAALGTEKRRGGKVFGRAIHIAPEAWLHYLIDGLEGSEIKELEDSINLKFPLVYRSFLKEYNGLIIFNGVLSFYGKRFHYNRSSDDIQPFDILTPNIEERPLGLKKSDLIIGNYDEDGSLLLIDSITNKVYRCTPDSGELLFEWNDFAEMLISELNRIQKLFDSEGKHLMNFEEEILLHRDNIVR